MSSNRRPRSSSGTQSTSVDRGGPAIAGMDAFSPLTRTWFAGAFAEPTAAQAEAWTSISEGSHTLVVAPTGSGKTLAAFLWALDRLHTQTLHTQTTDGQDGSQNWRHDGSPEASHPDSPDSASDAAHEGASREGVRVLYISPLKALAADVERNLRSPLIGLQREAQLLGIEAPEVTVGIRTGDTTPADRRRQAAHPPDVLITTPESLFLLLTSQARESLSTVETVIIDEVHALAGTKRGAHLAVSLERLDAMLDAPAQRIGLSATVRPLEEVAEFLGGSAPVRIVAPPATKELELRVEVPVEDMAEIGQPTEISGSAAGDPRRTSIWPYVEERVVDLIAENSATLVFANSRRLSERLTARLNEIWAERLAEAAEVETVATSTTSGAVEGADSSSVGLGTRAETGPSATSDAGVLARAHHGSVSKEQRALIEEDLKAGRLPAVVATSSLELGIDMGAVDMVVQVESPPSVASGLQRVGRAGHQVGAVSRGVVLPKFRGDLVQAAVVTERMRERAIEATRMPRNPLDVLAQHIVSAVAVDEWDADELLATIRRAAPFATLPDSAYQATLDMLSGRYPSEEFAELRPRLIWDRDAGTLTGRPGAQRLAVTSGGTIPDRGLFGVFLVGEKASRVGELDEEMVYESRVGDVFALGASSWRIEEITHDRVLVSPAPGQPGKMPFWHGDSLGRSAELGRALGGFIREASAADPADLTAELLDAGLDARAAANLIAYLTEQRNVTGTVPSDRTLVVERFRDEIGDWRVVIHSPFGARVHAPWALAISARLRQLVDIEINVAHSDDGIIARLPDTEDDAATAAVLEAAMIDPDEVEALVTAEVSGSALFASRFRECAARSLLLPRRNPGKRTPLWQQRQRSAHLLSVAAGYPEFPVVLETMRECLQDVFDLPALQEVLGAIRSGELRVEQVQTEQPSPFATSLLFGYVAAFLYEGDTPLAERRAQALTLDPSLLAELLGQSELRDLLDPGAVDEIDAELQRLTPARAIRDVEDLADALRVLGPLTTPELALRGADPAWASDLIEARRAIEVRIGSQPMVAAIEDAGLLRDALGTALPVGIPDAFLEVRDDAVHEILSRYARTHGPFVPAQPAERFGLGTAVVRAALNTLAARGRVTSGEFRPGGTGTEWCDVEVLRRIRRRSVAALRDEAEPVAPQALAAFLPEWQSADGSLRGVDGVLRAVEQLSGAVVPASALESLILPVRVRDYQPGMLDELTSSGEVLWAGVGELPGDDGTIVLASAELAEVALPLPNPDVLDDPLAERVLSELDAGAGWFARQLTERLGVRENELGQVLWRLCWGGWISNDTIAPLRSRLGRKGRGARSGQRRASRPRRPGRPPRPNMSANRALWTPTGPTDPALAGRWFALPAREPDDTARIAATVEGLLDRHGVLTRGAVAAERLPGGFSAAYKVLSAMEDAGRCRRSYAVEGLGAAQFALPGAVDRLRARAAADDAEPSAYLPQRRDAKGPTARLLAATDPANAFGAALPWPESYSTTGHRPGRKAGACVVIVDGELAVFIERGGKALLTFTQDEVTLAAAASAIAEAVRAGRLGDLVVQTVDAEPAHSSSVARTLTEAGFAHTPRGLRMRSR